MIKRLVKNRMKVDKESANTPHIAFLMDEFFLFLQEKDTDNMKIKKFAKLRTFYKKMIVSYFYMIFLIISSGKYNCIYLNKSICISMNRKYIERVVADYNILKEEIIFNPKQAHKLDRKVKLAISIPQRERNQVYDMFFVHKYLRNLTKTYYNTRKE